MNIFVLDKSPVIAAQMQCDKHIVKMVLESAQMLSTAHRVLDGNMYLGPSKSGKRTVKKWTHKDYDDVLYKVVHLKHPCTVWTMETDSNYTWHYTHFIALCDEYEYRYGRKHLSDIKLRDILKAPPKNIPSGNLTEFALAMKSYPQCIIPDDPIQSYRNFYHADKHFAAWNRRRPAPDWWEGYKG